VTRVVRQGDESIDSLLKRFQREVTNARILGDVKKNRYFLPKSERRKLALRRAVRRERRRQHILARRPRRAFSLGRVAQGTAAPAALDK